MIELLIQLLTPVFVGMGASAADVSNYLHKVEGYINGALIGLLVLIVILVATHWIAKKGDRHVIRWTAVLAFLAAVVILVNAVCYGPMKSIVSGFLNASKAEISEEVVGDSFTAIRKVGEEGMVLVKNDGTLPLSENTKALNVFGWASMHPVFSGTGSAASGDAAETTVDIITSLREAGYETNEELSNIYVNYYREQWGDARPPITMTEQNWTLPEPTMDYYTEEVMNNARSFSDTAVIVIARSGGENADLPSDMHAVIKGTFDVAKTDAVLDSVAHNYNYTRSVFYNNSNEYDEFGEGDHYLQLSQTEKYLVDLVTSNFSNVIVVINANNTMELGWVNEYSNIGAVILAPGTGANGMVALGEILNGSVNPSGRTADTYLFDLTQAPTWNHSGNSGNHLYDAGDLCKTTARKDNTFNGVVSFVDYVEGIYMGYKFYETAADEGLIDFDATVQYPFGYGLSYTTFSQEITDFQQGETEVTLTVKVTNTGSVAGKEVVQLYVTAPYTNGGIEKASVVLVNFDKTITLEPGQSQTFTFTVPLEDLASYDSSCIKTAAGGYVLEAGEYILSIRANSHTVLDQRSFTVAADIDYSTEGRSSDKTTAVNLFDDMKSDHPVLSRADHFANYAEAIAPPAESEYELSKDDVKLIKKISVASYKAKDHNNDGDVIPVTGAAGTLTLADVAGKPYDDPLWEELLNQLSIADMTTLINVGGWKTEAIASVGKVATSDCDGPSGLSNYVTGSTGTQFPTEVLMAQTWSKAIAEAVGNTMGQEFANASNYGWYGPAMNLHRSAFSGRNFEYYSEDPVLSGLFASAEVNAAAEHGVYSYIKHFAANDQETNRTAFLTTWMTEQTFRENCLRPFEIVVKNFNYEKHGLAVMSSYNWLGYTPVISSHALLTDLLRGEWGFVGMVISDYNGSYGYEITDAAIRAGNDLMLGYGMAETNEITETDSATTVLAMRQASHNILYTIARSGYYLAPAAEGESEEAAAVVVEETSTVNNMDSLFSKVNWGAGIGLVALEAIVVVRWLLKRKKLRILNQAAAATVVQAAVANGAEAAAAAAGTATEAAETAAAEAANAVEAAAGEAPEKADPET